MNLIVDVGNTRVKLALFEQGRLTEQCGAETLSAATLEGLLGGWGATGWLPPSVPPPSIRDAMR